MSVLELELVEERREKAKEAAAEYEGRNPHITSHHVTLALLTAAAAGGVAVPLLASF